MRARSRSHARPDGMCAAITVLGKGGKWRTIPLEDSELRSALDAYMAIHKPERDEHLLYPREGGGGAVGESAPWFQPLPRGGLPSQAG